MEGVSKTAKRKILAFVLAVAMIVSCFQSAAGAINISDEETLQSDELTAGEETEASDESAADEAAEVSNEIAAEEQAEASNAIAISSAEELAKIGADSQYPMDGDYVLTSDIDLTGIDWAPLGGYVGTKGTMNASDANVFSGTFDGAGYVISGMTINLSGSVNQYGSGLYGQVGLFSVIAGNSSSNYAEVKNLIFTDVSIQVDFTDGLAAIGTLAGEVNGYAKVENIAVLGGTLVINPSKNCDTVGAGGLIGECRTADSIGNTNVSIKNCYNGADVVASGSVDYIYAGGIVGRVAQGACGEISGCVNVGSVQYDGYDAYAIASASGTNASLLSTLTNCYYLNTSGQSLTSGATAMTETALKSGTLPENLSSDSWSAASGRYPVPTICLTSSAAGYVYLLGLQLGFAAGESASGVRTVVTLPLTLEGDTVTWSSSNEEALAVSGSTAVADTDVIGTDTIVELTASCGGYTRTFKVIVLTSRAQTAKFDQSYAQVGVPLTVSVSNTDGMSFTYKWTVGGTTLSNTTNSYTPTQADLESFITVVVTASDNSAKWELSTYCSELPVIYIDTEDGQAVTSNTVTKDATIKVQGNAEFNNSSTWYEGGTTIKGRGNSTWSQAVSWGVKKPYKLKLDSKSNLLGLGEHGNGKNKHWVLLANMIDHTNMRNEIVNNFSRDIGMEVSMASTGVVLILNGEYQGLYELCEHVRVGSARVDVFDWEDLADDVADAICSKNPALNEDTMEEAMEQDYGWVTSGTFTYSGKTYKISDYYTDEIPEFTGGFLLDMDFRSTSDSYKYVSTFQTSNGIPMFFRRPEYAKTSTVMMNYAQNYINAYEAALKSEDFTTTYEGETVHYTDLFDMDSLVQYWYVCELTNNWDSMKNSTYLYKDLTGKAKMGPAWDYDWAFGNINMYSMSQTFVTDNWHTTLCGSTFAEQTYQKYQWNRYLVKDPYFVTKAYEYWKKYRSTVIEDIVKDGGVIDTLKDKYQTASEANDEKWSYSYSWYRGTAYVNGNVTYNVNSQTYDDAVASLKQFIVDRLAWMDRQFTSIDTLYKSLGNSVSSQISVTADTSEEGSTVLTATVSNSNVKYVEFVVNGTAAEADKTTLIPVSNGKATITILDNMLESEDGAINTVEVLGVNSSSGYVSNVMNFTNFEKGVEASDELTGTLSIKGTAQEDSVLKAALENSNNSGELSYQWYADGTAIAGATDVLYLLTAEEVGKTITVKVVSSVESGSLKSAATDAVAAKQSDTGELKEGLIIRQIYAGGAAGDTPVSHDYIEIYNNSYEDLDLSSYTIGYLSNRDAKKEGSTSGELVKFALSGTVKAHTSYLIRCAENETASYAYESMLPMSVETYDLEWNRVLDNKQYQVILYNSEGSVLDAVSVGEEETVNADITDMVRLESGFVSKQKILSRVSIAEYTAITLYDSTNDIPQILTQEGLEAVRPYTGADGEWGEYDPTAPADPTDPTNPTVTPDPTDPTDPTGTPTPTDPTKTLTPTNTPSPKTTGTAHKSHVGKTFVVNGLKYKVTKDDSSGREVRVTSMKTKTSTLKIPAKVTNSSWGETFKVTSVKAKAFKGTSITKAVIGKNVTIIGPNAFKGCTKLTTVTIGKNVKTIGVRAFYGCTKLTKVTVKSTVLKSVKKNAFKRISGKAVIKAPAAKKAKYKNLFKGKTAKGVTIK